MNRTETGELFYLHDHLFTAIVHTLGPQAVRELKAHSEAERQNGQQGAFIENKEADFRIAAAEKGFSFIYHLHGPSLIPYERAEKVLTHIEESHTEEA